MNVWRSLQDFSAEMIYKYFDPVITASVCVATVIGLITYARLRKRFLKRYVKVGKVSKLFLYPVKAFAAQEIVHGECTKTGIKVGMIRDRMWTVMDDKGKHVDQKEVPRLVLLHVRQEDDRLYIDGPDVDTLELEILDKIDDKAQVVKCNVFGTYIDAVDCGEEAAKWIQKFSGKSGYRIVQYVSDLKPRPGDMKGICNLKGENFPVIFQADQPFLVISEASIDDLNSRIEDKITCLNFRPNILIEGCEAYDEEKWKYVRIGETVTFMKIMPCNRCTITTTNTETGDNKSLEPLATLRKYRLATKPKERAVFKYSPLFGMYYGVEVEGRVSVGDDVYAVYE